MKYLILIIITITSLKLSAQITDTLYIGFTKSIYLVFNESPIHHANSEDAGVEEIIVKTLDNKLIITAAIENFEETNMFVQDGARMYMFLLRYSNNPKKYLYNYQEAQIQPLKQKVNNYTYSEPNKNTDINSNTNISTSSNEDVIIDTKLYNTIETKRQEETIKQSSLENNATMVLNEPQKIYSKGVNLGKVSLIATNFYVINDRFYLKLVLNNKSKIEYEVEYERFIIKNKSKSVKKSADQFIELKPIYIKNSDKKTILPKSKNEYVYVFEKFTIQDNKKFSIEIWEKSGDRTLEFSFDSEDILKIDNL